jgi:hypothetical protein
MVVRRVTWTSARAMTTARARVVRAVVRTTRAMAKAGLLVAMCHRRK